MTLGEFQVRNRMTIRDAALGGRDMENSVQYHHAIVEGTAYQAGQLQGEFLKQVGRTLLSYEPPEPKETARRMRQLYDEYCPGLTEEIQGVADSLDLPFEKALFCAVIGPEGQGCTHAVALPGITASHHLLVARNYDMGLAEADLRLCTTRIEGRFSHLGFSDMCFGRLDGINEHGLCVTLSSAWGQTPKDWQEPHGFHYAIALRAVLDQCRTLEEAVDLCQRMPIGSNGTFLAADRAGNAACIEIAGRERALKRIDAQAVEQYLVSANHYSLLAFPAPMEYAPSAHSTRRHERLASWLQENRGRITDDGLKSFLDRDWATGVSGYSPEHQAGTLWSMVFDVTAGTVEIRFGPPPDNGWHSFTLDGPVGVREFTAAFPI
jgi:predicted choloylglycine hydrolase